MAKQTTNALSAFQRSVDSDRHIELSKNSIPDTQKIPVKIVNETGLSPQVGYVVSGNDNISSNSYPLLGTNANQALFNGITWDRQRNNTEGVLAGFSSRTASLTCPTQTNYNAKGIILAIDVTTAHATETLTIETKMTVNNMGSWGFANYTIPANTVGRFFLMVYPGITTDLTAADRVKKISATVPRTWFAVVTHSGSSAQVYSISYATII